MNAKFAHELIEQQAPQLLGDGTQLVSVYYFGQSKNTTVVGLERVGDDYLPVRWLVILNFEQVLGWYYPSDEFPVRFESGLLSFPKSSGIADVMLIPHPPEFIQHGSRRIPFQSLKSQP